MAENKIELKSVNELLGMKFFIPSYQRGYRWTEQQVIDLLNDILDFAKKDEKKPYEFYCVQPLVVKSMTEREKEINNISKEDIWYEVIDGQQRLTTIFIILKLLKDNLDALGMPTNCYELKYQRESNNICIAKFLDNIVGTMAIDDSYVDLYYMSQTAIVVKNWLEKNKKDKSKVSLALLEFELDGNTPNRDKANNVRFIWYESVDEDPIKVFTRLNIGKISLTNSELIKALFLNRSNFIIINDNHLELRQREIASEWDLVEYTLQNDEFWLFLNKVGYSRPTRIDFIFDLICSQNQLHLPEEKLNVIGTDEYRTFRYFYEYFKLKSADVVECWKKVKDYFQTFQEWYNDLELYHYVGFLVEYGHRLPVLIEKWGEMVDKESFLTYLKAEIKSVICNEFGKNRFSAPMDALGFQYKEDGSDKGKCKPILLFHNIQTIINQNANNQNNERYQMGVFYKFPFHLYKIENWDVEHINSNTTNPEKDAETQSEWLLNIYLSATSDAQMKIADYFEADIDKRKTVFEEIRKNFPQQDDWTQNEKNRIWNYTLLDSSTNRSYGNTIFSGKRRIIIGKDKGKLVAVPQIVKGKFQIGEETNANSSFVPPCTKQVFMKFYSATMGDANYWTKEIDAEGYLNDIKECIKKLED